MQQFDLDIHNGKDLNKFKLICIKNNIDYKNKYFTINQFRKLLLNNSNDEYSSCTLRIYPNQIMKNVLDEQFKIRNEVWNIMLKIWNDMDNKYLETGDVKERPTGHKVRNEYIKSFKTERHYEYSSRIATFVAEDLDKAWHSYFNKVKKKPKFKNLDNCKVSSFTTERAKIIGNKIRLDRSRKSKINKKQWTLIPFRNKTIFKINTDDIKLYIFYKKYDKYFVNVVYKRKLKFKKLTNKVTAIDLNIGHFDYTDGKINIINDKLKKYYNKADYYNHSLVIKRQANGTENAIKTNNYIKTQNKLRNVYNKIINIQSDIIEKATTMLVNNYDIIAMEDLDVQRMLKNYNLAPGINRSLFGKFRRVLKQKCHKYGKVLIFADIKYPSTQRCSRCGNIKTGDDRITLDGNKKHHTKHNEYICYKCGLNIDRDKNAVNNLLALIIKDEN